MKSFFELFRMSNKEMTGKGSLSCLAVTGVLCAVSMAVEGLTIPLPFAKVNFAFIAIAAIGMLYGPAVSFLAGGICDVLGYFIRPDGGFIPVYIFIAMFQGLIYGILLYRKGYVFTGDVKQHTGKRLTEFGVRMIIARLLDVIIINLLLNTYFNMYFGFIPKQAFTAAIYTRLAKNLLELAADIPLMFLLLPAILAAYNRIFGKKEERKFL